MRAVYGLDPILSGEVEVDGEAFGSSVLDVSSVAASAYPRTTASATAW